MPFNWFIKFLLCLDFRKRREARSKNQGKDADTEKYLSKLKKVYGGAEQGLMKVNVPWVQEIYRFELIIYTIIEVNQIIHNIPFILKTTLIITSLLLCF